MPRVPGRPTPIYAGSSKGILAPMSPLRRTDDHVAVEQLYDGDVIEHPRTGAVVTVVAAMQSAPPYLVLTPGVIDAGGDVSFDGPAEDLFGTDEGARYVRLYQFVADA